MLPRIQEFPAGRSISVASHPGQPLPRDPTPGEGSGAAHLGRRLPLRRLQQFDQFHLQPGGQRVQCRQGRVGQARLDPAQVGAEHAAALSKLLLGDGLLRAQLFDAKAQGLLGGE